MSLLEYYISIISTELCFQLFIIYKHINQRLKKYVFTDTLHTKVVKNIHGDSSGVRGAAWLS